MGCLYIVISESILLKLVKFWSSQISYFHIFFKPLYQQTAKHANISTGSTPLLSWEHWSHQPFLSPSLRNTRFHITTQVLTNRPTLLLTQLTMAIHTRALIPHRTRILIHQMRDIQEDIPRKPRQCPQRPTPPLLDRVSITTAPILVRLGKIGRRSLKLKENVSYLIWNWSIYKNPELWMIQ